MIHFNLGISVENVNLYLNLNEGCIKFKNPNDVFDKFSEIKKKQPPENFSGEILRQSSKYPGNFLN